MKRLLLLLTCLSLFFASCSETKKEESSDKVIRIGVILPMTGYAANWGEHIQKSIALAQKNLPPELQKKYEVIIEDGQGDNQVTPRVLQKLIGVDKVDALISCFDNIGNIIAPQARLKHIPHVAIALDDKLPDGQYNFTHWTPAYLSVDLFLREAQKRNVKTIAVIGVQHQFPQSIVKEIEKQISDKKIPIKIISNESFDMNSRDFSAVVTKSANTKPDVFLILSFPPSLELLGKKFKDLGLKNVTAIESIAMTVDPALFEGCWHVAPAFAQGKYADDFKNEYKMDPFGGGPNGYDAFNLLVEAFEKNSKNPAEALKSKGQFEGVYGASKVLSSGVIETQPTLQVIKNGKSILIEETK
jgi:branched-chain amino acid transport system substrate-binding protein